jgi:hypothetical protein
LHLVIPPPCVFRFPFASQILPKPPSGHMLPSLATCRRHLLLLPKAPRRNANCYPTKIESKKPTHLYEDLSRDKKSNFFWG